MTITKTEISDVLLLEPRVFGDERGYFFESYNQRELETFLHKSCNFVQDNRSRSVRGVLRGLHFQKPPFAQAKIVTVLQGSVLDVAVDIREGSPTFGKHVAVELSNENKKQLYIPRGFAHGFVVLSDTAEFFYKCDGFYESSAEGGVLFSDPALHIDWRIPHDQLIVSEKDTQWNILAHTKTPFTYET